jgi:hypothetical protein
MSQLDDRARSAVDALFAQLDDTVDARPPERHRGRAVVVALCAAAVVALVAGIVVLRDRDKATTTPAGAPSVPRLIPSSLPGGFAPTGAYDSPVIGSPTTFDAAIYAGKDDQTFAGPSIAVTVFPTQSIGDTNSNTDVNGHPATVEQQDGKTQVSWVDGPSGIRVLSRGVDQDVVLAAARSITFPSSGVALTAVPAGLDLVAQANDLAAGGGLSAVGTPSHSAGYQATNDGTLEVVTFAGDDTVLTLERYFLTAGGDVIDVRGHRGYVSTSSELNGGIAVVWPEAPGVVAMAFASAIDRSALLDLVEGLRPATDAEWSALQSLVPKDSATTAVDVPADALGSLTGTYQTARYTVIVNANGEVQFAVEWDGGGLSTSASKSSAEDPATPKVGVFGFDQKFGVVYGKAPTSVDRVRLVLATGDSTEGPVQPVAGQPFVLFAFGIEAADPAGVAEDATGTAIFLDAAGDEISRQPVTVTAH